MDSEQLIYILSQFRDMPNTRLPDDCRHYFVDIETGRCHDCNMQICGYAAE